MKSAMSVIVKRPIAEVFEFATKRVSDWSIIVVEDEMLQETPEGVGSTFRVVTEGRGKRMAFEGVVTLHEPPKRSSSVVTGQ
jgi:hypothetical protein